MCCGNRECSKHIKLAVMSPVNDAANLFLERLKMGEIYGKIFELEDRGRGVKQWGLTGLYMSAVPVQRVPVADCFSYSSAAYSFLVIIKLQDWWPPTVLDPSHMGRQFFCTLLNFINNKVTQQPETQVAANRPLCVRQRFFTILTESTTAAATMRTAIYIRWSTDRKKTKTL